jgi:hypothetical protein
MALDNYMHAGGALREYLRREFAAGITGDPMLAQLIDTHERAENLVRVTRTTS